MASATIKSVHYPKFVEEIQSQQGRVVVITGTTTGTGYVAAKTLLLKGATVVMLNRASPRVEAATKQMLNELESGSKYDTAIEKRLVNIACDLQSFASVRGAAAKVIELFPNGINILCNNAGIAGFPDVITSDGYEVQMQTNHLSHFLLTNLLWEALLKGQLRLKEPSRIVNHSSSLRLFPFTTLKGKYFSKPGAAGKLGGDGDGLFGGRGERYHQTKLANSVFTMELAQRIEKCGLKNKIIVVCAHPGWAATECVKQKDFSSSVNDFMYKVATQQSGEDGTLGILHCMVNDVVNGKMYGPRGSKGMPHDIYHGILSSLSSGTLLFDLSQSATNCTWNRILA